MGNDNEISRDSAGNTVIIARAKPVTALIFGLLVGLAIAVLLQQAGIWPLDKLTVFLLPATVALILIPIARIGRVPAPAALTVALILLVAPVAYGLTGIGEVGENGALNGGCTVEAVTDIDTTVVTDTSRSDPFQIVPDGPLSWMATSPGPITNHEWEIWVVVGSFEFVVESGGDENSDLTVMNDGDVPSVDIYVESLSGQSGEQIRGIYEVGGFIEGDGGSCDGFGFVEIEGGFLDTLASRIALAVAVLGLLIFLLIVFTGRRRMVPAEEVAEVHQSGSATMADHENGRGTREAGNDVSGGVASISDEDPENPPTAAGGPASSDSDG